MAENEKNNDLDLSSSFIDLDLDDFESEGNDEKTRLTNNVSLIGRRLGDIEILERRGGGGMGDLYRGHDHGLDKEVAIKVLAPWHANDPAQVKRFRLEAQATARLDHSNIVKVHNVDYQLGLHFIEMEFIEGVEVAELIKPGALEPRRASQIICVVARALEYAHSRGVIHRDIKPANILVSDDLSVIKVIDFGLAKIANAPTRLTIAGTMLGTPHYMSPEQALGGHVGYECDVYSLGITFYEILAGLLPFEEGSAFSVIAMHAKAPVEFPKAAFSNVPEFFIELIRGMCAKDAEARLKLSTVIELLDSYLQDDQPRIDAAQSFISAKVAAMEPSLPAEIDKGPQTNIAQEVSVFVGRSFDMATLNRYLVQERDRLVTLHGTGGTGKTRLARHWALENVDAFPAGIWFADLSESITRHGLCLAVAHALKVPLREQDPIDQISAALSGRCRNAEGSMLLILDNAEQIATEVALALRHWRDAAPEVQFLVTSREALGIGGEQLLPLGPLSSPPSSADSAVFLSRRTLAAAGGKPESPDSQAYEAVQLFIARVQELRPDYEPDAEALDAIFAICRMLDGIPLAIELAAARCSMMSPSQLMDRLKDNFDVLRSARRDLTARQATLRGAIDWSWTLLDEQERNVAMQLSAFASGFTMEAAEDVVNLIENGDEANAHMGVMDVLSSLVEKSFVRSWPVEALSGETRFGMFKSIQSYTYEKLRESQERPYRESLENRIANHYLRFAERYDAMTHSGAGPNAMTRLLLDQRNIRAAIRFLDAGGKSLKAARLAMSLAEVLRIRGPWDLRTKVLSSVLSSVSMVQDDALKPADRVLRLALLAELNSALAVAALDQGEPDRAEIHAHQAIMNARKLVDSKVSHRRVDAGGVLIRALCAAGKVAAGRSLYSEARDRFEEAINHPAIGKLGWEHAVALAGVAHLDLLDGQFELSLAQFDKAADISRERGDLHALAAAIMGRGEVRRAAGDYSGALECYREAAKIYVNLGDRAGEGRALGGSATCHSRLREYDQALRDFSLSEAIAREIGSVHETAVALSNLGITLSDLERYEEALERYVEAEALARRLDAKRTLTAILGNSAEVLHKVGESGEALKRLEEAEALARSIDLPTTLIQHLHQHGRIYRETGQPQLAIQPLEEAKSLMENLDLIESRQAALLLAELVFAAVAIEEIGEAATGMSTSVESLAKSTVKISEKIKRRNDIELESVVTKCTEILNERSSAP